MLLLGLTSPATSSAASEGFQGLSINPGFTQGSFQNLGSEFNGCGTYPHEATCVWSVRVELLSDPSRRCVASTPDSALVWESAPQSGNGRVDSGPQTFALEGCMGQRLLVTEEFEKTFGPWTEEEPPPLAVASGGKFIWGTGPFGVLEEMERKVLEANPAPKPSPMPEAPRFAVSSNCRALTIGATRFSFRFKRIGCRTATNIAAIARSDDTPNGYRCTRRSGGGAKCVRIGQPQKFVEWHLPRKSAAQP